MRFNANRIWLAGLPPRPVWPFLLLLSQTLLVLHIADSTDPDKAEITFEILPVSGFEGDGTDESPRELTEKFISSIHGINGESNARPMIDGLPILAVRARQGV